MFLWEWFDDVSVVLSVWLVLVDGVVSVLSLLTEMRRVFVDRKWVICGGLACEHLVWGIVVNVKVDMLRLEGLVGVTIVETEVFGRALRLHVVHCLEKVSVGVCGVGMKRSDVPKEKVVVLNVLTIGIWKFRIDLYR